MVVQLAHEVADDSYDDAESHIRSRLLLLQRIRMEVLSRNMFNTRYGLCRRYIRPSGRLPLMNPFVVIERTLYNSRS